MTGDERRRLRRARMAALGLAPALGSPQAPTSALAVARALGALQAQDYASGAWSLGVRSGLTAAQVEDAVRAREVVRTWPMRGTIHWVPAEDARWMCRLLAAPTGTALATRYRQLGIADTHVELAGRIFEEHLGEPMSRPDVIALLAEHGIDPSDQRAYHLVGHHCMTGLICQGPLVGKQPSFVLIDAWVPHSRTPSREEALATVAERYVRSHGPVTEKDLAGWVRGPLRLIREALALIADRIVREEVDGTEWLTHVDARPAPEGPTGVQLLPQWDELLLGYRSRDVSLPPEHLVTVVPGRNMVFAPTLVVDGEVAGTWRRQARSARVEVRVTPFAPLTAARWREVETAAAAYGRFVGQPVEVVRVEER
ncbi:winged helix DNA-binding domain-containing protein [Humibacillus xanthopallidus]|uniref:Winged helix DNA-binding protein n=1 Tax=Humibacillus xanthopallidus TaxID=412689 RepID=A0A543HJC4_9MICO|nr:winged helix DNA-binding domain-containing protein [Humibacillus xanthopallidus]TQM58424.1 winged helix DNA-binding protein [Humibacillus xanthopallidus]